MNNRRKSSTVDYQKREQLNLRGKPGQPNRRT